MKQFLKNIWKAFKILIKEQGANYSSSIAYSTLLSLFPFLIFLVSLASFIGSDYTSTDIITYAFDYLPGNVVETLQPLITEVLANQQGSLLTVGALGSLWAASSGLETLRSALNIAYNSEDARPFWKRRLQGMFMVSLTGTGAIILFVTIIGGPVISYISETIFQAGSGIILLWNIIRYLVGFCIIIFMAGMIYRRLPDLRQSWHDVLPGALISSMLWIMTATLFTWLVATMTDYSKTYGSLGGIITTLLFFQISAFIFIFGAEYNAVRLGRK